MFNNLENEKYTNIVARFFIYIFSVELEYIKQMKNTKKNRNLVYNKKIYMKNEIVGRENFYFGGDNFRDDAR